MFGWNSRPTTAPVKHLIGGDSPARVVTVGHGSYEVTIPDDPKADVTYCAPYYRNSDPRDTFPNMEVRDGEMRIPLDDIVGAILARVQPAEIAKALWQDSEVKSEFMYALAHRYSEGGLDDSDRRKFLSDVQEAVHDAALDKLGNAMSAMEYAIAKNYYLHSRIREVNDLLRHYDVRRPARGEEDGPQLIQIADEQHLGEFKIGGTAWNEARDFWRSEVRRQFPLPCDSDASLAEDPQGLSGEAMPARAEGIAQ